MSEKKKIWFPAKTYGWGWGPPVCWQGWVVFLVFAVLLIAAPTLLPPDQHMIGYFTYIIGLVAALLFVCWKTGEKPKWRWGKK
ncbi:MAG: hypothetical protein ISR84_04675 [Kiritimatiellales bacterium]|nr:hypothetical protein [Kiritimatiellales bacterium]